jgi:uncharacterized membrane protein
MFPFDYIPQTIDPSLRKFIIFLICLQFTAFVLFCFNLIQDHKKRKREAANGISVEINNETNNETNKGEVNDNSKKRESSVSSNRDNSNSSDRKNSQRKKMD